MKKKLLSSVLALSMLSSMAISVVSADVPSLKTHFSSSWASSFVDGGMFSYKKFHDSYGKDNTDYNIDVTNNGEITASVDTKVFAAGTSDLKDSLTVSNATDKFGFKTTLGMSNVKNAFDELMGLLEIANTVNPGVKTQVLDSNITGEFLVRITYDSAIIPTTTDASAIAAAIASTFEQGAATSNFFELPATNVSVDLAGKAVEVKFVVKSGKKVSDIVSDDALEDLSVTLNDFTLSSTGTHKIYVELKNASFTTFSENSEDYAKINYVGKNIADASVYRSGGTGGGGFTPARPTPEKNEANITTDDTDATIGSTINSNDSIDVTVKDDSTGETKDGYTLIIPNEPPAKDGFATNGYSTTPNAGADSNYDGTITVSTSDLNEDGSITLYPRYVNLTVPEALEKEDHILYIVGYPDGEVKPNGNITREEVTAALYRLLDKNYSETIRTEEPAFPDVAADRWSNTSIATMAKGGFIVGDLDGNFNPGNPITRAEFATLVSTFAPAVAEPAENHFSDISGHWAERNILIVAGQYWLSGYPDGTFRPNSYITRAEAMSIINRVLVRYADHETTYIKEWPDVDKSDWFYDAVTEATTSNFYARLSNGWLEQWVADADVQTQNQVDEIMKDTYGDN